MTQKEETKLSKGEKEGNNKVIDYKKFSITLQKINFNGSLFNEEVFYFAL